MNNFNKRPKANYGFIYIYTSPSGKSYVGQTTQSLKERAKTQDGLGYEHCTVFYNAIKKYGFENFTWKILGEFPIEELDEKETYYIKEKGTLQPKGYNIMSTGGATYNLKGKRKTKINQFDLNGNFIKTYESVIDAAKENNTLYQAIEAVLLRKRPQHNGYIYRYYGENSPDPITIKKTHGRATGQYDINDNLINIYPSANQAALAIGKNSNAGRNIRAVCDGKRQTAYGFKWKYLD